jgi:hypothetical protein
LFAIAIAIFPLTAIIGIFASPAKTHEWFIRWQTARLPPLAGLLVVPLLLLSELLQYGWNWATTAHLLGIACGLIAVLLLPTRIRDGTAGLIESDFLQDSRHSSRLLPFVEAAPDRRKLLHRSGRFRLSKLRRFTAQSDANSLLNLVGPNAHVVARRPTVRARSAAVIAIAKLLVAGNAGTHRRCT